MKRKIPAVICLTKEQFIKSNAAHLFDDVQYGECAHCHVAIVLAKSTRNLLKTLEKYILVCEKCSVDELKDEKILVEKEVPGGDEEIAEANRREQEIN